MAMVHLLLQFMNLGKTCFERFWMKDFLMVYLFICPMFCRVVCCCYFIFNKSLGKR